MPRKSHDSGGRADSIVAQTHGTPGDVAPSLNFSVIAWAFLVSINPTNSFVRFGRAEFKGTPNKVYTVTGGTEPSTKSSGAPFARHARARPGA